jgi:hypothetical protein
MDQAKTPWLLVKSFHTSHKSVSNLVPAGLNSDLLRFPTGEGSSAVIFDYFEDPALPRRGRMDMLEVKR